MCLMGRGQIVYELPHQDPCYLQFQTCSSMAEMVDRYIYLLDQMTIFAFDL